jgi:hypothetical protein
MLYPDFPPITYAIEPSLFTYLPEGDIVLVVHDARTVHEVSFKREEGRAAFEGAADISHLQVCRQV